MSNNFTAKAEAALNRSVELAESLGHTYIGTEHVLLALVEDKTSCASILLKKHKITHEKILCAVREYSGLGSKSRLSSKDTTPKCRRLLENSYKISKKYSSDKIGSEHLLLAILDEKECVASKVLTKTEADLISIKDSVITFLRSSQRGTIYAEPATESLSTNLTKYGKNLSAAAERGELDPVVGREKETERLIRVLSRRSKNNPCLIGEAGVGKTAIVEGLAQQIFEGRVPPALQGKTIISLDLTSMVAGAKYRGDFEERIKNIMSEAAKNKSIILFIDEIHTIVGAGSAEGAIDAANIMKPELSRSEIQLIGATTLSEYRKYIEKDSALERRFQPIIIEQPDEKRTIDILNGIKDRYEKHHGVTISDSAIHAAARLSERYIQDRFLPDKAIDILDEACAMATNIYGIDTEKTRNLREKIRQTNIDRKTAIINRDFELAINLRELEKLYSDELNDEILGRRKGGTPTEVTESDVCAVIKEITGIDFEQRKNTSINDNLSKRIIGQDDAVDILSKAVKRSLAGINCPNRPRGVFLFIGESGVGKTELAKALSMELFNSEDALIRYDMSEFSESYTTSKLIGSAPGYVGYDEQNSALEKIRKHPYSVVLFDEIDKAHPDVLSILLQIFDTGCLTDATGRKISFRNCYVVMTANISEAGGKNTIDIGFSAKRKEINPRQMLRGRFKNEFINRIDEVLLFKPLDISALKEIAKIKINNIIQRLKEIEIELVIQEDIYEYIAKNTKLSDEFGARGIERVIQSEIENKIADLIVNKDVEHGEKLFISIQNDKIECTRSCLVPG